MPGRTPLPADTEIIRLHDEDGLTFPAIGALYGLSDGRSARYAYLRATDQLNGSGRRSYGNRAARRSAPLSTFAGGSARTFGVEIECDRLQVLPARSALTDAGLAVADTRSYTHEVLPEWKTVSDATVSGCEAVSPPLAGQVGVDQVRTAMRAMKAAGASISGRCGMHVHVSMDGLNGAEIAQMVVDFAAVQGIVDSFLPGSRRSNRGNYSGRSINPSDRFLDGLREHDQRAWHGDAHQDVRNAMFSRWGHGRYCTLNFQAFLSYGTVEFRQHAGTLNGKKAAAWVEMLITFVEASQTGTLVTSSVTAFLDSLVRNGLSTGARDYLLRRAEVLGVPYGTLLADPEPEPVVEAPEPVFTVEVARPFGYQDACSCHRCSTYRTFAQANA